MITFRSVKLSLIYLVLLIPSSALPASAEAAPGTSNLPEGLSAKTSQGAARFSSPRFERLSVEDGLSENAVISMLQDEQGYLWFGTRDGLNRYDGYEFQIYKNIPGDPGSLSNSFITSLYQDRDGILWVGTFHGGLNRFDPETGNFTHYQHEPTDLTSLSHNRVRVIFEDSQGVLWVGTHNGLNVMDRQTGEFVTYKYDPDNYRSLSGSIIRALFEDQEGNLWVGTDQGLNRFDRESKTFTRYSHDPVNSEKAGSAYVLDILETPDGRLWLATETGLYYMNKKSGAFYRYHNETGDPNSLSDDIVNDLFLDQSGNLWVGTENGGLNRLIPGKNRADDRFVHYMAQDYDPYSLSSNAVRSILQDRSGVLWLGTYGGGLSKLNRNAEAFGRFLPDPDNPKSISGNSVNSFAESPDGKIWIGTFDGLDEFDPETGVFHRHLPFRGLPDSLEDYRIRSVTVDRSGVVWAGTDLGSLYRLDPVTGKISRYTNDPADARSLSSSQKLYILEDSERRLWVGSYGTGLDLFDPKTGQAVHFRHDPLDERSLSDNNVLFISEGRNGELWIGTESGGLNLLDPQNGKFTVYQNDPADPVSLSHNGVAAILEDTSGDLWIGTLGGGLNRFDREAGMFEHYGVKEGLPGDRVLGILPGEAGELWISTSNGLARFDPVRKYFRNYFAHDGLQGSPFNTAAALRSKRGELYFGGPNGFNTFYPHEILPNPHVAPIYITAFKIFNEPFKTDLTADEKVLLSYRENFISFDFVALDFVAPEKNQYAYKLEGVDKDWVNAGSRRYASYTNLRGGTYTFRVKGANSDGLWNETGTSLTIVVSPPFWEHWWARAGAVFVLIGLAAVGYRFRVKRIETQNRLLSELVDLRTAELRREIEGHERTETALRKSEAEYRDVVENSNTLILRWDTNFRVHFINRYAQQFFGYPEEEIIGKSILDTIVPDTDSSGNDLKARMLEIVNRPEEFYITENENLCSNGRRAVIAWTNKAVYDRSGKLSEILSMGIDRTEQKHVEEELARQSEEAAIAAERNRLARELHDAVTQTLFSVSLIADVLPKLWERDPNEGRRRLEEVRRLTRGALAEMRTLLIELRPSALADAEIGVLLRHLTDAFSGRTQIPVDLIVDSSFNDLSALSTDVKLAAYRIAQEALNNIAKHARASRVEVRLEGGEESALLTVIDDGLGFELSTVSADHLGLGIMRERSENTNAELKIQSQPGVGTQVQVCWKFTNQKEKIQD